MTLLRITLGRVTLLAGLGVLACAGCGRTTHAMPVGPTSAAPTSAAPTTAAPTAAAPADAASTGATETAGAGRVTGLPAVHDTFVLTLAGGTREVDLFGALTETASTATSCTFAWNTGHPITDRGTATVSTGQTVTLHSFRDARITLDSVVGTTCSFTEDLPAT